MSFLCNVLLQVNSVTPATTHKRRTPCYVYVLAFLSAIGGFLFGYDTGVVAGATLPIQEKFSFTIVEKELFVSITSMYYLVSICSLFLRIIQCSGIFSLRLCSIFKQHRILYIIWKSSLFKLK